MTRSNSHELDRLAESIDGFGHMMTSRLERQVALKVQQGLSEFRDEGFVDGSVSALPNAGRIDHNGTDLQLRTGADGSHVTRLEAAELLRYVAGAVGEVGIGVRLPSAVATSTTGPVIRWGGITPEGIGLGFGVDAGGIFIWRDQSGSGLGSLDTKVYQSDWNVDTLEAAKSGFTYDLTSVVIHHVRFMWYGQGPIEWRVAGMVPDEGGRPRPVTVHRERFQGAGPVIDDPSLAPFLEIDNDGTASATEAFVYGRQSSMGGPDDPDQRMTFVRERGVTVGNAAGWVPLLTVRRKANETDGPKWESANVQLSGVEVRSDQDIEVAFWMDPDYTLGGSWANLSERAASETALEKDDTIGSASLDGGLDLDVFQTEVEGGQGNRQALTTADAPDIDLKRRHPHVLAANVPGGSDATVDAKITLLESW